MSKQIYCRKCGTYLGEIRDATLKKGLEFVCAVCVSIQDRRRKSSNDMMPPEFKSIFGL